MDSSEFHAMFHEATARDWDEDELRELARMWADTSGAGLTRELGSLGGALRLYTDGSCAAPGEVGGWAWILVGEHAVASGSGVTPGSSTHQVADASWTDEKRLPGESRTALSVASSRCR